MPKKAKDLSSKAMKFGSIVVGAIAGLAMPLMASAQTLTGYTLSNTVPNDVASTSSGTLFPLIVGIIESVVVLLVVLAAIKFGVRILRWVLHKVAGVGR